MSERAPDIQAVIFPEVADEAPIPAGELRWMEPPAEVDLRARRVNWTDGGLELEDNDGFDPNRADSIAPEPEISADELAAMLVAEDEGHRAFGLIPRPDPAPQGPDPAQIAFETAAVSLAGAAEALGQAQALLDQTRTQTAATAMELGVEIGTLLVGDAFGGAEPPYAKLVEDALASVAGDEATRIRVSPEVHAVVGEMDLGLPIEEDPALSGPACLVDLPDELVDASIATRIDAVRRALLGGGDA